MPKARNPKADEAEALFQKGLKLVDIANRLNLPEGTVRRWKSTYKWDCERSEKKTSARKEKERAAKEVNSVMANSELTDKQRLFCLHYVKSFNATKSYQKAYGCDYETANAHGYEMLSKVVVRDEIMKLKRSRFSRALLEPADIFSKYMDIAFADATDYVSFGRETVPVMGPFGPIRDKETGAWLTKEINTVKFQESSDTDGTILAEVSQGRDGAKVKLADRMKALQWLSDHMGLATDAQREQLALMQAKFLYEVGQSKGESKNNGLADAVKRMEDRKDGSG